MTALTYVGPRPAGAGIRATGMVGYCPWRHLGELEGVSLTWHRGGDQGVTDFESSTISLRTGLSTTTRRATLAHELAHIERGPGMGGIDSMRSLLEEQVVELTAALRLIPAYVLEDLPELLERHGVEAAEELLGVDRLALREAREAVLRARVR